MPAKVNRRIASKTELDFYPTPPIGTESLLRVFPLQGDILEPCCGDGAMAKVFEAHGFKVTAHDIVDRGYGTVKDVFSVTDKYCNIVTNPPFNLADQIFHHVYPLATRSVCMLLRTSFLEGQSRYENLFKVNPPTDVYVFSKRLSMYKNGLQTKGSGTYCFSWFVWDKYTEHWGTKLHWIPPPSK